MAYVAGWQQLLDGQIVTDADRAGSPALAAEGAAWVAELGALSERGWGARCLRGCARVCLCTDAAGTASTTGRQLL